ncbi:MAG TPA: DUF2088 domain-containing protein, partial [Caldithrix abyssi]|nr:DUF2088 domain-containing protein [Caldithrix abyssi]
NNGLFDEDLHQGLITALEKLGKVGRVLIIPPDFTRSHSFAGPLTYFAYQYFKSAVKAILPALGTHSPMPDWQRDQMYPGLPAELFIEHNWRQDVITLGEVPAELVYEFSEGKVNYAWPAQVNRLLPEGSFDLILSIGQVVPHEVAGMANYTKNIFVGTGGTEGINKSHFLGAAYGIECILGRADNPVRKVLQYAADHFTYHLPIVYVLTVVGKNKNGDLRPLGLFIGDDAECYYQASELSLKVNFELLEKPLSKIVVYLDPAEFKSTWLGNKSIYRTRMALADQGELIVLAPGLKEFGEDPEIDRLIRKYGYRPSDEILELVKKNEDLQNNLSAAAHLMHSSSDHRFTVTYCPGHLSRQEIEQVHYQYADLKTMLKRYPPEKLQDGFNELSDGEQIYFISNPALGLWAFKVRFQKKSKKHRRNKWQN